MKKLTLVYGNDYFDKIQALVDGQVSAEGIDLISVRYNAMEVFFRTLKYDEFDMAELSFDSFLPACAHGQDLIALPVFPIRRFFQADVMVAAQSGIERPEDLRGKRFGVPEYQMSMCTWTRGVLQHDFGVSPDQMVWYVERSPELSHGGATGFRPPPNVRIEQVPADTSLSQMLLAGELDAAMGLGLATALDRSGKTSLRGDPRIRPLFDQRAESARFFRKYGYVPPNHVVVLKGSIVREHPWVAMSLFKAFEASKAASYRRLDDLIGNHYRGPDVARNTGLLWLRQLVDEQRELFGADPSPYGMRANRPMMQRCVAWLQEQGFLLAEFNLEALFAEGILNT